MKTLALFLVVFCAINLTELAQSTQTERLHALFDREWEWTLETYPTFASYLGDKRYNSRWEGRSLDAIAARNKRSIDPLGQWR